MKHNHENVKNFKTYQLIIVFDGSYDVKGADWVLFIDMAKEIILQLRHITTFVRLIIASDISSKKGFEEVLSGKICEKWKDLLLDLVKGSKMTKFYLVTTI